MPARRIAQTLYRRITGDDGTSGCRDISAAACREQPRNFGLHLLASAGTKLADELINVRLVLPWVLGALGAPIWMVGWLVPIRDGGALLPQLALGAWVRARRRRKVAWTLGNGLQGVAAGAMAAVVWAGMEGLAAGWSVLGLLAALSVARSLSSLSSKDVLGRTISKDRRGSVGGWAGSIASGLGMAVGVLLSFEVITGGPGNGSPNIPVLGALLLGAGGSWGISALCIAAIREEAGTGHGDGSAMAALRDGWRELRGNRRFLWFNLARFMALGSALALPYLAVLGREASGTALRDLGVMVVAAGLGGMVASPVWGRFADRASHKVLAVGAGSAAVCAALAGSTVWLPDAIRASVWPYALLFALALMAHGGIRLGRSTHVVNLAGDHNRAILVATSNTLIGAVFLPLGAGVGALAPRLGTAGVLWVLAAISAVSAGIAWRLDGAERD